MSMGEGATAPTFTEEAAARDAAAKQIREGWPRVVVARVAAVYERRVEISVTEAS